MYKYMTGLTVFPHYFIIGISARSSCIVDQGVKKSFTNKLITPETHLLKPKKIAVQLTTGKHVETHPIYIPKTMVKTKKGRQTNNSTGRKRSTPPRLRQVREKRKENERQRNEIDITTLADDDPTPSIRRKVRDFISLMGDDSSSDTKDEDLVYTEDSNTPRKGEDKKRQRFATETEVIEVHRDHENSGSESEKPKPLRLMDKMDSDSDMSIQPITIAEILGEGPEDVVEFPHPTVITKDCRYTCQVKVPPCDNPSQYIAERIVTFLKWLQDKIGKDIAIATWDDATEKNRVYSKPHQLPKPPETALWTAIWGAWVNIKPQQDGTAFLKIRLVTKSPDLLAKRLPQIGEIRDEIRAATGISIGRLPIACQAVQAGCVGWLFGSNKHMNSSDLLQEITKLANIPAHVRMGISWRAIKLENGKTPPWVENGQPASALHVDMDYFHAPVYKPILANLFKKHGTTKPLGLSLRLIPCFSSDEGKNATPDRRSAAVEMREKQEYLVKEHITVIKTPYILNLDKPTKPNGTMTLRRYLKNLHPQGLVAARLILSVDKAWQEGSKDTNIVTTREYAPQAQEALRNMIPECVHRFGTGTKGWFTREGLLAFKGVEWDPAKNKSVSDRDVEALRTVAEDYFGMGEAWRNRKVQRQRPIACNIPGDDMSGQIPLGNPGDSIPNNVSKTQTTIETLLAATIDKKNDAPSFGDLYQRPHDGDTARTSQKPGNDDASLSSHESEEGLRESVTFANIPDTLPHKETATGDMSTAKSSTHYRLQRDKCRELAEKSQEESRQLLETLKQEREELMRAREELERLKVSTTASKTVTPSANRGRIGAAADSADNYK
jgi:hypothetical protein